MGLDVPLADVISPAGARIVDSVLGDQGLGQFLPGVGDAIDARDAVGLLGDAIGAASRGEWDNLGLLGSAAAVTAMGALPGVDAPPVKQMLPAGEGIRAYHGSPHDFDRFSLEKIGTGEGNQAYGHGLYLAGSEGVARHYRDMLAPRADLTPTPYDGRVMREAKELYASTGRNLTLAKAMSENFKEPALIREALDKIDASLPKGHMYEVEIASRPDQMLDWDATLDHQPGPVQEALRGNEYYPYALEQLGARDNPTGGDFYRWLTEDFGQEEASEILQKSGLTGIQYLDGASRLRGEGSKNYVVFDDRLISILKKYGIAGLLAAPALAGLGYRDAEASE